ncbi:MAG: SIMPL domain-containing protein [Alphaproteobacteria bacterium]|nr:SIMPL domain-containing protein [Alphaproteobacteria bacterium]
MKISTVLAVLTLLLVPVVASADEDGTRRTLAVTGQGAVQTTPDMAEIQIGVMTRAATAREALTENNDKATRMFAFLRESGIADRDMQSVNLSISPQYDHRRKPEPTRPELIGYVVNNNLRIVVRDLEGFGKVLDGVVSAGANTVHGIRFDSSKREELEREATANAVKDAVERARNIATAAGVSLGKPITIQESGGIRPPVVQMAARMESADVPIASGELAIGARVSIVFELD